MPPPSTAAAQGEMNGGCDESREAKILECSVVVEDSCDAAIANVRMKTQVLK
jgi:hypothetical protein